MEMGNGNGNGIDVKNENGNGIDNRETGKQNEMWKIPDRPTD